MFLNVWNWSLLRSEGKVQNWVRRRFHYLNLCEAHGLNTWGQLLHIMNNGRKFSTMRRTSCSSLSKVFIDPFFLPYLTYVSYIVIAGLWKFYYVSSNNTKWEYEWTSTRILVTNPVIGRRISTGRPVTAWIAMRKDVTGKEFTLTSWKTEIAKSRRARTTWTLCKRRTGEAIPRAAKFGRIDGQNLAAERSVMK